MGDLQFMTTLICNIHRVHTIIPRRLLSFGGTTVLTSVAMLFVTRGKLQIALAQVAQAFKFTRIHLRVYSRLSSILSVNFFRIQSTASHQTLI